MVARRQLEKIQYNEKLEDREWAVNAGVAGTNSSKGKKRVLNSLYITGWKLGTYLKYPRTCLEHLPDFWIYGHGGVSGR